MQTFLQIGIGVAPLIIFSIITIIRKKLRVIPIMMTLLSVAAIVMGVFVWNNNEEKKEYEKKVVSAGDYLYLAEKSMSDGDFTAARAYLDKMYKEVGDTPKGTIANARLEILSGDYDGARVLYEKVEKDEEGKKLLAEADTTFEKDYDDGKAISQTEAAGTLSAIDLYKKNGGSLEELGYKQEDVEKIEKAAKDENKYEEKITGAIKEDLKMAQKEDKKRYESLSDASELAKEVEKEYDEYKNGQQSENSNLDKARKELDKIYKENPSIFEVDEIDEAFVKALIASGKYKDLIEYANATNSPTALIAIAQEYIRGNVKDKDFPDDFISVTEEEQKELVEACTEALEKITEDDKLDESEVEELEEVVDKIKNMDENAILNEIDSRVHPENESLEDQSKLYFGNSTIDYAIGNEDRGDKNLNHALETYAYSDDGNYVDSVTNITKVINGTADDDEVKNVSDYFTQAYDNAVITNNNTRKDTPLDENGKPDTTKDPVQSMAVNGSNYVSKKLAMINVSGVDISSFPEVKLTVQTGEKLNLKDLKLSLSDCDINIPDFKIEKVDYSKAKIYVVCDNSGSMKGSIETLQDAVRSFVSTITDKEEVAVVTFSSNVLAHSNLTKKPSDLDDIINGFRASGGTNVASGAFYALGELAGSSDSFNVIMLMTDGEDSSFSQSRLNELEEKCAQTNTVLYTIGLGSAVKPEYLKNVADYGGGSFVYCTDAVALDSLYRFIHKQMENTYKITYTAVDTATNKRHVTITNNEDASSTTKYYTLGREDNENFDDDGNFIPSDGKIHINGLDTKKVYKNDTDVIVGVGGANFEKDQKCSVSIQGDAYKGTFEGTYVSEYRFNITIPKTVPAGTYTATIVIDGHAVSDTLEVLIPGKVQTLTFGKYVFRAQNISKVNDTIQLSGDVSMNDFIHFNGAISITGKIPDSNMGGKEEDGIVRVEGLDEKVTLTDNVGSYIEYSKNLPGLFGKLCSNKISLLPLGSHTLYDDKKHYSDLDNYMVEEFSFSDIRFGGIIYQGPSIALYPHKINMKLIRLETKFPLQEEILTYAGKKNPFGNITCDVTALINNSGLYAKGKAGVEGLSDNFSFGAIGIGLDEITLEFDTFKSDYKFTLMLGTGNTKLIPGCAIKKEGDSKAGYGFDIGIKGGKWDSFTLYADFPIVVPDTPVSFSKFFIGVEDMASVDQDGCFAKKIFQTTFIGGCDISVAKVADYVPAAKPFVGDLAFVTFEKTTNKYNVLNFKYEFESTAKLFGEFEIGKIEAKAGKYDYEDYYLDIDKTEVIGIYFSVAKGPNIDYPNFKLKNQGVQTYALNSKAFAYKMGGNIEYEVNFLGNHKGSKEGYAEVALVDLKKFMLIVRGRDLGNNKDAGIMICLDGFWDSYIKFY